MVDRLLDGLIAWAIRSRMVVLVGAVVLTALGVFSALRARTDVLPDFVPPRVVVQVEARGMTTLEVEEHVTVPIERALLGTPESTLVRSTSSAGLSVITLFFTDGTDVYRARQLVTERLDTVRARLPPGTRAQLAPVSAPIGALVKFVLTSPDASTEEGARQLQTFADWTVRPRLLAVAGVSQVVAHGGAIERVEVRPDPLKLRTLGLTLDELAVAVREAQSTAGLGFVIEGERRLDVRNASRILLADAEDRLRDTVIRPDGRPPVRLGDVATVVRGSAPRLGTALYDGKPALYIQVSKLPGADTLRVTREVDAELVRLKAEAPVGVRFEEPVFRQADFLRHSLVSVLRAMTIGGVLVIVILVAFLRRPRLAFISAVAIPLSLIAAVLVLVAAGATINGMTLGGLALAVGEVVDDAIVDVENAWRRLRENARAAEPRPAIEVIRAACAEVRGSVVYATVLVGVVLVPVLLLGGLAGRIFAPLAQAYILAIFASLVVALTVTPALSAWLLPKLPAAASEPTRAATWLLAGYRRVLARAFQRPRLVLLAAVLVTVASGGALPFLGGRFLPELHEGALIAHVHAVPGTSLEVTGQLTRSVTDRLLGGEASHVAARIGRAELDEDAAPTNRVEMDIVLRDVASGEWDAHVQNVARRIGAVPGVGFVVEGFLGERIHEILAGETAPLVVKLRGPDLGKLRELASDVAAVMHDSGGFGVIQVEPQIDVPQVVITPDGMALARYGVRPAQAYDALAARRQGLSVLTILAESGRSVDVVLTAPPNDDDLGDTLLFAQGRGAIPASEVLRFETRAVPSVIQREGGERRITIAATPRGAALSTLAGDLEQRLRERVRPPPGYRIEVTGEAAARGRAALELVVIGAAVLVGIFVFLTSAFRSARDALIVLLNIPLGLAGGVVAAAFAPEGLSVAGFVGFVTLFGIIARNGIMLVSHKRALDAAHPDVDAVERVRQAAEERLLPIVMTAAAAGLGLLPLALSFESAGSELEAPMALIVIGGLVTATALNLVVLPTVYVWLARRQASTMEEAGRRA